LFRNPTGVSLAMFPFRGHKPASAPVSLIFVGNSSLRKGCDILTEAIRRVEGTHLTHVGAIGDFPFPTWDSRFTHIDHVPQPRLVQYYAEADVLALASREEGMSAVMMQALAAGLPIICTDHTGGADLAYTPALAARITVVPSGDVDALAVAIAAWRDRLRGGDPLPPLLEQDRQLLSWSAYALRHSDELLRAFG
jgi:glycosyltransferase involved in cell wall biosynthesis